ncbi:Uncharacterized protein GBIM_08397 [Gryllus bimaculatus]|nr:Uncharacterized protein GBIM_08397 [Gryllus bimaculatus]
MNSTLVMRSIGRQGGTVWTVWCMCAKLHEFQSFLQDPESSSRLETVKRTSLRQSIANLFATPPSSKRPEQNEPQTTVKNLSMKKSQEKAEFGREYEDDDDNDAAADDDDLSVVSDTTDNHR